MSIEVTTRRKSGRCSNGEEKDGGKVLHIVLCSMDISWGKSLCGTSSGIRGNGWDDIKMSPSTCEKCKRKLSKLTKKQAVKYLLKDMKTWEANYCRIYIQYDFEINKIVLETNRFVNDEALDKSSYDISRTEKLTESNDNLYSYAIGLYDDDDIDSLVENLIEHIINDNTATKEK
ncbi:hypothetical protein [Halobacteriovorax sp. CON-3]|uniref:hypothetical protein n=1 Tax=Halobacteriovorax sp. CON-3 TaxID=3157710 RepID=UPI0037221AAD